MVTAFVAFLGAACVVAMVPGASTAMILRQAVVAGRRCGMATVLGNELGVLAWGVAAALGVSALLLASAVAYDAMRIAGAVVLLVMGVRALWRNRRAGGAAAEVRVREVSAGRAFRLGVLTNLANPKAGVFAVSFLPQFVPHGAPVLPMLLAFSLLWALVDLAWYAILVWLVGRARRVLERPSVKRRMEQISGLVLIALGVRLATDTR